MRDKIKYVLLLFVFMGVFPLMTHAECDYQREAELSRIASNVQVSYSYDENANFTVTVNNITNDIYLTNGYNQTISGVNEYTQTTTSGVTIEYNIYSNDNNCKGEFITSKYVTTPTYNAFADYDECKMYPEFKYCQKWSAISLTYKEFQDALQKYKTSKVANNTVSQKKDSILDKALSILNEQKIMIIIIAACIIVIIIFKIKK
jgi:hypothetical protein